MFFKSKNYIGSFVKLSQLPTDGKPEFALVGRSNVGKSSLVNYLTHSRKLAKVSHTPGKTQTINYFSIEDQWYLVDLPGYGYAKVSKKLRNDWGKMIKDYISKRETLYCLFLLIDARIPPQQIDLDFMQWLGEMQIPFVIVFTKADKTTSPKIKSNIDTFKNTMLKSWETLPATFITSAKAKSGKDLMLKFIQDVMKKSA